MSNLVNVYADIFPAMFPPLLTCSFSILCFAAAIDVGKGLVESAANLVPESVPRPMAKGGVALAGGIIAFWLLQKVNWALGDWLGKEPGIGWLRPCGTGVCIWGFRSACGVCLGVGG